MKRWTPTPEANQLLLEGSLALSEVEANGIRVDRGYLESAIADVTLRIRECEASIRADPDYAKWRRRYGDKTNTASPQQLAGVVFGELGLTAKKKTAKGTRDAADEASFEGVDLPIVRHYFAAQKLRKGRDTYLEGIRRELVRHADGNWYVHPFFHLNTVETFRSSASDPNIQNQPARNPVLSEMVRRCYIPRPGHQLLELDYGQIEVRVPCAYTFDPVLIDYVCDPTKDMHRDMAAQVLMLEPRQVSKEARNLVKNQMVFPLFYGSFYCQIAPAVWDGMELRKLRVEGSDPPVSVRDHLASKGIHSLGECDPKGEPARGTFEHHVKAIQEDFWGRRFRKYAEWKEDWVRAYHRDGGCRFLTGFVMKGPHKRNDITNYCIQGSAFHLDLWSIVRINRRLKRLKMRSRMVAEIHDSNVFDAHPRERDDLIYMARKVMTEDIREWARWLNVPLLVEPEACPVDASWFDKAALKEEGGRWVPADGKKWESKYGTWETGVAS